MTYVFLSTNITFLGYIFHPLLNNYSTLAVHTIKENFVNEKYSKLLIIVFVTVFILISV